MKYESIEWIKEFVTIVRKQDLKYNYLGIIILKKIRLGCVPHVISVDLMLQKRNSKPKKNNIVIIVNYSPEAATLSMVKNTMIRRLFNK